MMTTCNVVVLNRNSQNLQSSSFAASPCLIDYRTSFYDNVPEIRNSTPGQFTTAQKKPTTPTHHQPTTTIMSSKPSGRVHQKRQPPTTTNHHSIDSMSAIQMDVLKTRACCELNSILLTNSPTIDPKLLQNVLGEPMVEQINRQLRSLLFASVNHLSTTLWSVTRLYDDKDRKLNAAGGKRFKRNRLSGSWNIGKCEISPKNKRPNNNRPSSPYHQPIFNRSLMAITRDWGHPLPEVILEAMEFLIKESRNAVGIFRKPGLKSRIERLCTSLESGDRRGSLIRTRSASEQTCDDEAENQATTTTTCPYDVADLCKRFFRDLPEPILTRKLSTLFLKFEQDERSRSNKLYGIQMALILLPDENRVTLLTLLWFLNEIAGNSTQHQMTIPNLSTCFAPTLFAFSEPNSFFAANNRMSGIDEFKEVVEQKLAVSCLSFLIENYRQLSVVPPTLLKRCTFKCSHWTSPCSLAELKARFSDTADSCPKFVDRCIAELIKESHNKGRKWTSCARSSTRQVHVFVRKLDDGCPLPLWKISAQVQGSPEMVLDLILHNRDLWDDDYVEGSIVRKLPPDAEIFAYTQRSMAPHPCRQFTEFRCHRNGVKDNNDGHFVVCTSISIDKKERRKHEGGGGGDSVEAVTMAARFLIRPLNHNRSHLSYLSRVDLRGYSPQWYWKSFGSILQRQITKMQDILNERNQRYCKE